MVGEMAETDPENGRLGGEGGTANGRGGPDQGHNHNPNSIRYR